jgi:hypothetical protein
MYEINDTRSEKEFISITFSKFQKSKVKKELIENMKNGNIEPACYWCAELICAGHYSDLWEVIIHYISTQIHLGNPKLPMYIVLRFKKFKEIVENGYVGNELFMRNNINIRKLFAEIITTLCLSRRKHMYDAVKINKQEDFNITYLANKLKAPNVNYASLILKERDPKELLIAVNEFAYHLSDDSKNSFLACYWLEWILEFEMLNKKKKEYCFIEERSWINVPDKNKTDIIWIIWEVILEYSKKKKCNITEKIINSLLELFCIRYSSGVKRRRKYLIYNAISLLTEPVNYDINIMSDTNLLKNILENVNCVYKEIKKSEYISEDASIERGRSNLDKTVERLEKMKKMDVVMLNAFHTDV